MLCPRHPLAVLRANSVIAEHLPGTSPVDEELRRFDDYMKNVSIRDIQGTPRKRSLYLQWRPFVIEYNRSN